MATPKRFIGVGKRKTAVARLYIVPGDGTIEINGKTFEAYLGRPTLRMIVEQPFDLTGNTGKFNVVVNASGGGLAGQAGAIRHAISRALLTVNSDYRKPLKKNGFLTRDSRVVERKKYGHRKARKRSQYSKR